MSPTLTGLGKIAYESYGNAVGHKNHQGDPMPDWDKLPGTIQLAWICAAVSARRGYV